MKNMNTFMSWIGKLGIMFLMLVALSVILTIMLSGAYTIAYAISTMGLFAFKDVFNVLSDMIVVGVLLCFLKWIYDCSKGDK